MKFSPKLYGRILVPPTVCDELKALRAPDAVRLWMAQPPAWLEMRSPNRTPDAALMKADIDAGERDAILLAQELAADELIMDDQAGRREAERRHLHFIGTIGVLLTASRKGLLDLKTAIERLRQTNFHVTQDVLDLLMKSLR